MDEANCDRLIEMGHWRAVLEELQRYCANANADLIDKARRSDGWLNRHAGLHAFVGGFILGEGWLVTVDVQPDQPVRVASRSGGVVFVPRDNEDVVSRAVGQIEGEGRGLGDQSSLESMMALAISFGEEHWLRPPVRVLRLEPNGVRDMSDLRSRSDFGLPSKGRSPSRCPRDT
jgi:hypothetical protein